MPFLKHWRVSEIVLFYFASAFWNRHEIKERPFFLRLMHLFRFYYKIKMLWTAVFANQRTYSFSNELIATDRPTLHLMLMIMHQIHIKVVVKTLFVCNHLIIIIVARTIKSSNQKVPTPGYYWAANLSIDNLKMSTV